MRGGFWLNRHITFIVPKKLFTVYFALYTVNVWGGSWWLKTSYGGGGWLETSEYRHMRERGSIIAKKTSYNV